MTDFETTDDPAGTPPPSTEPRFDRRQVILAGGSLGAIGLGVLVVAILFGGGSSTPTAEEPTGSASGSDPATPSEPADTATLPFESVGASPTSYPETASGDPTPSGGVEYASAVVAWDGRFVAVGHYFEAMWGGYDYPNSPLLWTSPDGESWIEQPLDLGAENVSLLGLAPLNDGRLLTIGVVYEDFVATRTVAWATDDARIWRQIDLQLPAGVVAGSFAFGPKGFALTTVSQIWYSADGLAWTLAHEVPEYGLPTVVAGDEGFVARGYQDSRGGRQTMFASGDGRTWFEARNVPGAGALEVTSLGGDWLALAFEFDPSTIAVWWSANGLDWTRTIDVNDLTGPDGPKAGQGMESGINGGALASGGGQAYLTLTWNHCCAQMAVNVGVWTSSDGRSWSPADYEDGFIRSVASDDGVTVLVGHIGRGEEAAFWVAEP